MNTGNTLRILPTGALGAARRGQLLAFAESRGMPNAFLARRLATYPLVVEFHDGAGLAAFQLVERHEAAGTDLVYLGPLVSRSGAYLNLFAGIVAHLTTSGRPFRCAAEFENTRVLEALRTLLPTRSWPGRGQEAMAREHAAQLLAEFLEHVPHMAGFDPETMTTRVDDAWRRRASSDRYQLAVFGGDGSTEDGLALLTELEAGLAVLRTCARRTA